MSPDTQVPQLSTQHCQRCVLLLDPCEERFPLTPHQVVVHARPHAHIPYTQIGPTGCPSGSSGSNASGSGEYLRHADHPDRHGQQHGDYSVATIVQLSPERE
jgi:hypothetical protein